MDSREVTQLDKKTENTKGGCGLLVSIGVEILSPVDVQHFWGFRIIAITF